MNQPTNDRPLAERRILLIVGGGISAYKSVMVAREILRLGGTVDTIVTRAACHFVSPVTFAGITGRRAHTDLWDPSFPGELHVELTRQADLVLVAPATADLLANAAHGLAHDLATTALLCARSPVIMAPAMHTRMWQHPATQANVQTLTARGIRMIGPAVGPLASGEIGIGRMSEPEEITAAVIETLKGDLMGMRILVTAGPTHEAIDPVRFVSNRSSGKMGVAIATRARERGATVTLIHGPLAVPPPAGVHAIAVRTALEMRDAVVPRATEHDVVIMAAAVADYRPAQVACDKIKKGQDPIVLTMVRNPDILAELGAQRGTERRPLLVGFAVETEHLVAYARNKLEQKRCDLVVANLAEHGFEGDDNVVTIVSREAVTELGRMSKRDVADRILDMVRDRWRADNT